MIPCGFLLDMRHVKYSTSVYQHWIPMLKKGLSLVPVWGSVLYLVRMILTRLWQKTEVTNPNENLAQIRDIRKLSENTPTVRQKG